MPYLSCRVVFRLILLLFVIDLVNACVLTHIHLSEAKRLALVWHNFCTHTHLHEPGLIAVGSSLDKLCNAKTQWVIWSSTPVLLFLLSLVQRLVIGRLYFTITGTDVFSGGALSATSVDTPTTYIGFTLSRLLNLVMDEYMRWSLLMQISLVVGVLWCVYRQISRYTGYSDLLSSYNNKSEYPGRAYFLRSNQTQKVV
jgi:hypothetical protein